mmetsp:Transcript_33269/g.98961  ORF Transcript_33269/g.98961 Transcript_33269/m.98961 type:complete len:201 (-) Transcript_33269:1116-1718(-)
MPTSEASGEIVAGGSTDSPAVSVSFSLPKLASFVPWSCASGEVSVAPSIPLVESREVGSSSGDTASPSSPTSFDSAAPPCGESSDRAKLYPAPSSPTASPLSSSAFASFSTSVFPTSGLWISNSLSSMRVAVKSHGRTPFRWFNALHMALTSMTILRLPTSDRGIENDEPDGARPPLPPDAAVLVSAAAAMKSAGTLEST